MMAAILRDFLILVRERQLPVRLHNLSHNLRNRWYERSIRDRRPKDGRRIHFVYFSCARDFRLLRDSLRSLRHVRLNQPCRVWVFVDGNQPFTDDQIDELRGTFAGLEFRATQGFGWAGLHTIRTELAAFHEVAAGCGPDDYVAKVDSDILFLPSDRLERLMCSDKRLIGDGHYERFQFCQGGLYLLHQSLVNEIFPAATDGTLERVAERIDSQIEDRVIYQLCRRMTDHTWLTTYMMFPHEYAAVDDFSSPAAAPFVALHFTQHKHRMHDYFKRIYPNGD